MGSGGLQRDEKGHVGAACGASDTLIDHPGSQTKDPAKSKANVELPNRDVIVPKHPC